MKRFFSILLVLLFSITLFAASNKKQDKPDLIFQVEDEAETKKSSSGPFGLRMGMTLSDITKACGNSKPTHIENDAYYVRPVKTHPLFKYYIAYVDDTLGLYCLKAISDDISTNEYGTEVKDSFSEIKDRITKTYGTPRIVNRLDPSSIWDGDAYWIRALSDGARTYAAIWESNLKDDLVYVSISASAKAYPKTGWITLEYHFSNKGDVEDSQDDVF